MLDSNPGLWHFRRSRRPACYAARSDLSSFFTNLRVDSNTSKAMIYANDLITTFPQKNFRSGCQRSFKSTQRLPNFLITLFKCRRKKALEGLNRARNKSNSKRLELLQLGNGFSFVWSLLREIRKLVVCGRRRF
jgi:hypothetical protein